MRTTPAPIFDNLPIATLLVDTDGTILAINVVPRSAEASLVGRAIGELEPELDPRWNALVATARAHGQAMEQVHHAGSDGDTRDVQYVLGVVDLDGRELVQAIAIDLTTFRAIAGRAEADEQTASKQRLESLGLVAGGIAHDFNNLLVGVLAEASAAREDPQLPESTRESLRRIEASARRMSQLTRQLLAYAGRGQFVTIPTDADELLRETREQLIGLVPSHLRLDVIPGAGVHVVEADHGLLRQVIVNLVANAADAARSAIRVATCVMAREGASWWQLEVSDDGPGMDASTLARIFEPFFSTKPGRHGLGLSAVHGIVRRIAGDVEVDSTPGGGSRFRVRLPIVEGAEPTVTPRRVTETGMAPQRLAGLRALVADDEPSVRATVRRLLERRGATVVAAADGLEAEARLRADTFDFVVLDVSMPGRTGHEVMAIARAIHPRIPVVLMSGYTERIRGEGSEEEADVFLEKPFTARVLDEAIDGVLVGKRRG